MGEAGDAGIDARADLVVGSSGMSGGHDAASFDDRAEELAEQSARLFGSPESVEGITAFLQKRAPSWAEPGATV